MRPEFWSACGHVQGTESPLTVLCAARAENRNYLFKMTFGPSFAERYLGRVWLWRLTAAIRDAGPSCSLVFCETRGLCRQLLRVAKWFEIPCWVAGEVQIPIAPAILKTDSVKSDLGRIRKHALGYEVTRDPERLAEFYHSMYLPYIANAHGRSACITAFETVEEQFRDCELLLVSHGGRDVAGTLLAYEAGGPRLWLVGVRDANPEYVRLGVIAATQHFSFQHLANKGYRKVQLGASRAFLRDGVLRYKHKLDQQLVGSTRGVFAMKVLSWTTAAQAFLLSNPFIFHDHGRLNGAVFVRGERPLAEEDIVRIDRHYFHAGMAMLCAFCMHPEDAEKQQLIPGNLKTRVTLRPARHVISRT